MQASNSAASRERGPPCPPAPFVAKRKLKRSSSTSTYDQGKIGNASAVLFFDGTRFPSGLLVTKYIPTTVKRCARKWKAFITDIDTPAHIPISSTNKVLIAIMDSHVLTSRACRVRWLLTANVSLPPLANCLYFLVCQLKENNIRASTLNSPSTSLSLSHSLLIGGQRRNSPLNQRSRWSLKIAESRTAVSPS